MSFAQSAFLHLANVWCYLRHPIIVTHAVVRAKAWLLPATPLTVTEKFLWRKLFDRNPMFTLACDKIRAKAYAIKRCPQLKTAAVLWSGIDPDEIADSLFDRNAVLKANHGSGWNVLELENRNPSELRETARKWLKQTYGWQKGEWGYKNASKRIIVEQALRVGSQLVQEEYKFHVSCGTTAYVFVKLGNNNMSATKLVFSRDGAAFTIDDTGVKPRSNLEPPAQFFTMRAIAERLADAFDFVRCDFYGMTDGIYFSEFTVYPMSGHGNIGHEQLVELRNSLWDIRTSWLLTTQQRGLTRLYARALRNWLNARERYPGEEE